MDEDFNVGDTVEIRYRSERSGGEVSRKGTVLQLPGDDSRGLFAQTDTDQLTGVMDEQVFSLTVDEDDGDRGVQRTTKLGDLIEVEKKG